MHAVQLVQMHVVTQHSCIHNTGFAELTIMETPIG